MDKERLLEQVGLSDKQAKVYLALLELGESTIGPIAARSGVKRTSIYNFIQELIELGIISQTERNGRAHYLAEDPQQLERLVEERARHFRQIMPELEAMYQAAGVTPTRVTYYRDQAGLKRLLFMPLHEKIDEILYVWHYPLMQKVFNAEIMHDFRHRREEAKIWARIIEQNPHFKPVTREHEEQRYRVRRKAPPKLEYNATVMLYGNKISMISSRAENFGILIESKEFAQILRAMFEGLWSISEPVVPEIKKRR